MPGGRRHGFFGGQRCGLPVGWALRSVFFLPRRLPGGHPTAGQAFASASRDGCNAWGEPVRITGYKPE
ncbi:MAG: hypothetical protein Q8K50_23535 [Hydrogenophaga sp.]|nr:hypothetical protein [Hydrogenophaga sp.]